MKKVFLIGDSVRQGYDRCVKAALKDTAEVSYPSDNSMYSVHVLRWLNEYKRQYKLPDDLDCIHWNAGLWDTLTFPGVGIVTPLGVYKDNIDRICRRMRDLFPKAVCVFATSTPVIESRFDKSSVIRYNRDVEEYNEAAVRIVKSWGGQIDDLYSKLAGAPGDFYIDTTHPYTEAGTKLLTDAVVKSVCGALGLEVPQYDFPGLFARKFLGE